jgi:tetratricopeptide (TPR) repeat protein
MRRLNRRYALILFAVFVALAAATRYVHSRQINRYAGAWLDQANRAEAEGRLDQAADHLSRYIGGHPDDAPVVAQYGRVLTKLSRNPKELTQAFLVLDRALAMQPDDVELRREVVNLALRIGGKVDAVDRARVYVETHPTDVQWRETLAECQEAAGDVKNAEENYRKTVSQAPGKLQTYVRLARLLRRRLAKPIEGDAQVEAMVAKNETSARAWLLRAVYYRELGTSSKVAESVEKSYALAPDDAEVLLAKAVGSKQPPRGDGGRPLLERGVKLYPKDARFYVTLARVDMREKNSAAAARRLRDCLSAVAADAELTWNIADLMLDAGERREAKDIAARLRARGFSAARVAYLEGRLMMKDGAWLQAARRFERLLPELQSMPELTKRADLFLGQCYEQLGNTDMALTAYRRATTADPLWVPARGGAASALLALGKIDAALDEYRAIQVAAPEAVLAVARLLILKNLGLPEKERDWPAVQPVLDLAEHALPDSADVLILRAEFLAGQNEFDEASKLLVEKAGPIQMKQASYWVARAGLAQRQNQPREANTILADGEKSIGPVLDFQLAKARYWARNGGPEVVQAIGALERAADGYRPEEQARLKTALAEAELRLGRKDESKRLWTQVAETEGRENSLYARLMLFDLDLAADDDVGMRQQVDQIRAIEGEDGVLWRYGEAARLVRHAKRGDPALTEARSQVMEIMKRRATWSRLPHLQATIAEIEGNTEEAIRAYKEAVDRGERRPEPVRRVVQLLYDHKRFVEAEQIIRRLSEQAPISGDLMRLAAEISIRKNDANGAIEFALRAVPKESADYRDHIWVGTILWAAGQNTEADKHLRQAVALAEKVPDPYVARIQFLARTGENDKAEEVLRAAQSKLPPEGRELALAHCDEALGRENDALAHYQAAVNEKAGESPAQRAAKDGPDAAAALRGLADFHLRHGRPQAAQEYLHRLLDARVNAARADAAWARRSLAFSLTTGGPKNTTSALELIGKNRENGQESDDDLRARAVVLAMQPGRRAEAIRQFEDLGRRYPLLPDEQFLLAKLYQAEGDWRTARTKFLSLVAGQDCKPLILAYYIDALLQRNEAKEAGFWVEKLNRIDPNDPATVELKVRVLSKLQQVDDALAAVEEYSQRKDAVPQVVAALLDNLGEVAAEKAEQKYNDIIAKSRRPHDFLRFANFLARQRRVDEAVRLCELAWQSGPPDLCARPTAGVLRAGKAGSEQTRRVEAWLNREIERKPSVELLLALADVQDYQGRPADAIAIYRRVLSLDDRNGEAMNNMAWLLAVKLDQPAEALAIVDRAIDNLGRAETLLDTRAVIYLKLGKPPEALADLGQVIAKTPTGTAYFHQAQAYLAAHDRTKALEAYGNAKLLKLQPGNLHPSELPGYHRLLAELGTH